MIDDPIFDEVRRWREEYAARFNFDLKAIFDDRRRGTEEAGRTAHTVVNLPPHCAEPVTLGNEDAAERRAG
jgi:hypothetical protein